MTADTDALVLDAAIEAAMSLTGESPAERARLDSKESLRTSALYYASIGWPVFPLVSGEKRPATTNGLHDASTSPSVVQTWWEQNPTANIGVATGVRFDVIDVDAPLGFDGLAQLQEDAGANFPRVLAVARTGSGGAHLFITPIEGATNGARLRVGIDYRARGGYVVVPPSRLHRGERYRWTMLPRELIGDS